MCGCPLDVWSAVLSLAQDCFWHPSEQWATRGIVNRFIADLLSPEVGMWLRHRRRATASTCSGLTFGRCGAGQLCGCDLPQPGVVEHTPYPARLRAGRRAAFGSVCQACSTSLLQPIILDCADEGVGDEVGHFAPPSSTYRWLSMGRPYQTYRQMSMRNPWRYLRRRTGATAARC